MTALHVWACWIGVTLLATGALAQVNPFDPQPQNPFDQSSQPQPPQQPQPPRSPLPPQPPQIQPRPAPGQMKFVRAAIRDPMVNNEEGFVVLIPAGWQMQGQISWMPTFAVLVNPLVRISDPATGTQVDWLPYQNFMYFDAQGFNAPEWGNYQGKLFVRPIAEGPAFVQAFWMNNSLAHLKNAKLVGGQEMPGLAAEYMRLFGGPCQAKGYRLRYEYDINGQAWEEDVVFGLLFSGNQQMVSWQVNFATATRAPKGMLDRMHPITSAIIASAYNPPVWSANLRICQDLFRQGIMQQMRDTVAFGAKLAEYRQQSAQLSQQIHEERMASADRRAEAQREYLGGIETYKDTYKGENIQLPAGYKDYWVNAKGEYILSEQTGVDPNVGSTEQWRRMERRDPMNPGDG